VETFARSGALSISTVPRAETALIVVIIRAGLGGHISTRSASSPNPFSRYSRLSACRSTAANMRLSPGSALCDRAESFPNFMRMRRAILILDDLTALDARLTFLQISSGKD
jgi:hypothetical protein